MTRALTLWQLVRWRIKGDRERIARYRECRRRGWPRDLALTDARQ